MASVVVVPAIVELVVEVGGVEVDEELEDDELELGGVVAATEKLLEPLAASRCRKSREAAESVQVPSEMRVSRPVTESIVHTAVVKDE